MTLKSRLNKQQKQKDSSHKKASSSNRYNSANSGVVKQKKKQSALDKVAVKLNGARFRMLNEQLYTTPSDDAFTKFTKDPSLFQHYHCGFREQVQGWPINPLDVIIKKTRQIIADRLKSNQTTSITDMGCGEGRLAVELYDAFSTQRRSKMLSINSFDMAQPADNPLVTACNIAHTPLKDQTQDLVIFSLALMGTDHVQFLREAHRILKVNGILMIAEVESRLKSGGGGNDDGAGKFIQFLEHNGFRVKSRKQIKMFIFLDFIKVSERWNCKDNKLQLLEPCTYKRR
ncbi:hypothetical protein MIR68_001877 [Amoeboaphelidium protococcarum]|nr:hypothetical protein MIR68_001877 [Amoeboaphelidium protococcarum]